MLSQEVVYSILNSNFDVAEANSYDSNQVRIDCPYCVNTLKGDGTKRSADDEQKLYVHLIKQVFYCQRCSTTGPIKKFFKDTLEMTDSELKMYEESPALLSLHEGVTFEESLHAKMNIPMTEERKVLKLPREYKKLDPDTDDIVELQVFKYLLERGLTIDTIDYYKIGYCKTGYYEGRVIIPCLEDGEVIYFTNRICMLGKDPIADIDAAVLKELRIQKTLNPKREGNLIGKSEVVLNIDSVKDAETIIITEGPFDAINVGKNAVAILGSMISVVQVTKILKCKPNKIIMMLDPDALNNSLKGAQRFEGLIPVHIALLKDKDPGELTKSEVEQYINEAVLYNSRELEILTI